MANHKSAKKRARQNEQRRLRNKAVKTGLKSTIRTVTESVGDAQADTPALLTKAIKAIDKARSKGVLHKNTAARKVGRLTKRIQAAAK